MIKVHVVPDLKHSVFEKLTSHKSNRQKCQILTAEKLAFDNGFIDNILKFYLPKSYASTDEKYDTTALKAIFNNCKIFSGWSDPHGVGWFQIGWINLK
jgi:hypothetical protein